MTFVGREFSPTSKLAPQYSLGQVRRRVAYGLTSQIVSGAYVVFTNSWNNMKRAVDERVLYAKYNGVWTKPHPGNQAVFNQRLHDIQIQIMRRLGKHDPWEVSQFIDSYEGRKRTIYANAASSLEKEPINQRDAEIKAFVKCEKIEITEAKPNPVPRLIQPREPRFNLSIGVYIKPLEKKLFGVLKRVVGETVVMKGLNAAERGKELFKKWNSFQRPCCIGLDASRFDQHVRKHALLWCHKIYKSAYGDEELSKLLSWTLANKVHLRADDGYDFIVTDGGRASGDMDTSLGNCLLTVAMLHTYIRMKGIKARICCDGDDALVFMERENIGLFLDGAYDWYVEMGFEMKFEAPVFEFNSIEFCKCQPVWNGNEYVLARKLEALSKDIITVLPLKQFGVSRYLKAIGDCGVNLTAGVPIFQAFYKRCSEFDTKPLNHDLLRDSGLYYLSLGMDQISRPITERARYEFYLAFGILPDVQREMEQYYASWSPDLTNFTHYETDLPPVFIPRSGDGITN